MLAWSRYLGQEDLAAVLAFAHASAAARAPLRAAWRPGDVAWQLKGQYEARLPLYLARRGDDAMAVLLFEGPGVALLEIHPEAEDEADAALAFAEGKARSPALSLTVFDKDERRQAVLAARGYQREGPAGVQMEQTLADPIGPPVLPEGFAIRDSVGVDPDRRSKAHRDPWSALDHMDIHGESGFSTALYQSLATSPVYEPAFDLLIEGPDGDYVANLVAWPDRDAKVGHFEPVGVSPAVRGRRFTAILMQEAMRRMQAVGVTKAEVGTAHFNTSAIKAYEAAGFAIVERTSTWTKTLEAA
jgi:ribosomal protein S18 acetylase RimI-like enzyme